MPQLLQSERNLVDKMVRSQGKAPVEAWRALKTARFKKTGSRNCGPAKQSVYNYVHGHTHRCDKTEKRGRGKHRTNDDVRKSLQTRRRLIKQAASTKRVRYCDIIAAAKLGKSVRERTVADNITGYRTAVMCCFFAWKRRLLSLSLRAACGAALFDVDFLRNDVRGRLKH